MVHLGISHWSGLVTNQNGLWSKPDCLTGSTDGLVNETNRNLVGLQFL